MQSRDVPLALLVPAVVLSALLIFAQCGGCFERPPVSPEVAPYAVALQGCVEQVRAAKAQGHTPKYLYEEVYDPCVDAAERLRPQDGGRDG